MLGRRYVTFWLLALGVLASFVFVSDAMAQANLQDASGSFNGLLDLIKNSAAQWDGRLRNYALRMFWLLAAIQFVWTFFPLVFRQADFGEIVGELVRFIMVIGFFYALLYYSRDWAEAIVDSFRTAGANAAGLGTSGMRPGDMFGVAVELAKTVGNTETWNPLTATMIALAAVVVLLCFAFIAAFMGLTIIESYVVINASVLFMGAGGSQWTREYALAIMRYAVSVGAKLFVLTLIVGLVVTSAKQWQQAYNANQNDVSMWTMVGLSLACAYLSKTIPDIIQGLITGSSMGGGSAIGGMAAAGAAGAAAAMATIATAGAAAPAAAGALGGAGGGAAGAGAAGAAGGGGLAGAINASFAGQSAAGAAGSTASAGSSMAGSGASAAAKAASPRVGGSAAASGPSAPAPKPSSGGAGAAQQAAKAAGQAQQGQREDGQQQAAQPAPAAAGDQAEASTAPSASAAPEAPQAGQEGQPEGSGGSGLRTAASGMTRAAGILSAISVPGMEGAAGLSLGAAPPPTTSGGDADSAPSMKVEGAENIIRPVDVADVPQGTPSPAPTPSEPTQPPRGEAP